MKGKGGEEKATRDRKGKVGERRRETRGEKDSVKEGGEAQETKYEGGKVLARRERDCVIESTLGRGKERNKKGQEKEEAHARLRNYKAKCR